MFAISIRVMIVLFFFLIINHMVLSATKFPAEPLKTGIKAIPCNSPPISVLGILVLSTVY